MLSDITISVGSQSVTFPGLYLLIGCLIVLGLIGFIVAMTSSRRIERKTSEATDILVVQLERIGDALDRLVTQSAARAASEPAPTRQRDRFLADWAIPGRGTPPAHRTAAENGVAERAAQKPIIEPPKSTATPQATPLAQEKQEEKQPEEPSAESHLSEPARSILYSMLGR
ncbi:MAG TPA: hypothetical protein VJS43_16960 [Candidatus Acidoferrales bacterium]|nr:hypothetical protein [Candidatus Acidoferrales bacterium]